MLDRLPTASAGPDLTTDALERHRPALTRLCRRMLGSGPVAEDAVQETLLRAWRAGHRFEGRAPLAAWLFRIARNVCLDELHLSARRPLAMPSSDAAGACGSPADVVAEAVGAGQPDDDGADPAAVVLHRETVRLACVVAVQVLPPRQRAAFVLCAVLRVPAREAAELLDTSVASVNSSLQRARAALLATEVTPDAVDPVLDAGRQALAARYAAALTTADAQALVALAREDSGPAAVADAAELLAA
jgi:RNA polymerase sigma-70 factor (ECF subfamily)